MELEGLDGKTSQEGGRSIGERRREGGRAELEPDVLPTGAKWTLGNAGKMKQQSLQRRSEWSQSDA